MQASPTPPSEGWTLKEALLAICPEEFEMYVAAESAAESAFSVPIDSSRDWGRPTDSQIGRVWSTRDKLIEKLSQPLRRQNLRASARIGRNGPRQEIPFDQWDSIDWLSIEDNAVGESKADGTTYFHVRIFAPEDGGTTAAEPAVNMVRKPPGRPKTPDGEKKEDRVAEALLGFFRNGQAHHTTTDNRKLASMLRDMGFTIEHKDRLFGYAKARALDQLERENVEQLSVSPLTPSSDDPPA